MLRLLLCLLRHNILAERAQLHTNLLKLDNTCARNTELITMGRQKILLRQMLQLLLDFALPYSVAAAFKYRLQFTYRQILLLGK